MEQGFPDGWEAMLHDTPVPEGRVSERLGAKAAICPVFPTWRLKPIWPPALTVALSAVFASVSAAQPTSIVADAWSEAATLVAESVAVLA
jgi:hypothetical protein